MFQLLDLDYELDLDEMLNISSRTNEILERFDTIADALNQTTNGFLHKNHLDKLEAMKGVVSHFNSLCSLKKIYSVFRGKMEDNKL